SQLCEQLGRNERAPQAQTPCSTTDDNRGATGQAKRMSFDNFDRIRVVNLPDRVDRRKEMSRQLTKVGLHDDPRVSFFPAKRFQDAGIFRSAGSRGCFTSHREVITEAAEAGESVLIFEDDCTFLPEAVAFDMPLQWDVFYGGYVASDPENPETSDII